MIKNEGCIIKVNVGMFGLGEIGSSVVDYHNKLYDEQKTGVKINLKKIVVKDINKPRLVRLDPDIISDDQDEILKDEEIDIVIELIGGYEPARSIILESLEKGKDVVTANKAVLAKYGKEIFTKAKEMGRNIGFQASVCGEMRVLDLLSNIPSFRDVNALVGILNGTSNYILTKMEEGETYENALRSAKEKGFTESDPRFDVEGTDAAQKLSLLASIVFGAPMDFENIYTEGIKEITKSDIKYAKTFGYTIKSLAIAKKRGRDLELRVHPTLIPIAHPLASVKKENNALSIYFENRTEPLTIIGKGAGKSTARSIMIDVVEIARKRNEALISIPWIDFDNRKIKIITSEDFRTPYCLRFSVEDKPGILGSIAVMLGKFAINISGVTQVPEDKIMDIMPLAIKISTIKNQSVYEALQEIKKLPDVKEILPIRIYE